MSAAVATRGQALVAGVGKPEGSFPELIGTEPNARRLAALFRGKDYSLSARLFLGSPKGDDENIANSAAILESARDIGRLLEKQATSFKAKEKSPAIILLDGHGKLHKDKKDFLYCAKDTAVSFRELLVAIQQGIADERQRARCPRPEKPFEHGIIIILSTCHSGAAVAVAMETVGQLRTQATGAAAAASLPPLANLGIITSTTTSKEAFASNDGIDPFTQAVIDGFKGGAGIVLQPGGTKCVTAASLLAFLQMVILKNGIAKQQKMCCAFIDVADSPVPIVLGEVTGEKGTEEVARSLAMSTDQLAELVIKGEQHISESEYDKVKHRDISYACLCDEILNLEENELGLLLRASGIRRHIRSNRQGLHLLEQQDIMGFENVQELISKIKELNLPTRKLLAMAEAHQQVFCQS